MNKKYMEIKKHNKEVKVLVVNYRKWAKDNGSRELTGELYERAENAVQREYPEIFRTAHSETCGNGKVKFYYHA